MRYLQDSNISITAPKYFVGFLLYLYVSKGISFLNEHLQFKNVENKDFGIAMTNCFVSKQLVERSTVVTLRKFEMVTSYVCSNAALLN